MRVPQSYIQKCKAVAHIFQALLVFIAGCLTLAVIAKDGPTGSATKYYIALVCLPSYALRIGTSMIKANNRAYSASLQDLELYTSSWFLLGGELSDLQMRMPFSH